jgi:predicted nucleic acid-binding protein
LILLDSTVIVGFLDADDALHAASVARLRELAAEDSFAASIVGYAEVMTGVRLGHHPEDRVSDFFEALIRELIPVDRAAADRAAELRAGRRSLRMPDALILASADLHEEVDLVLCGDGDWLKIGGLRCAVELVRGGG